MENKMKEIELTILMPCLDEAETIEICVNKAKKFLEKNHLHAFHSFLIPVLIF